MRSLLRGFLAAGALLFASTLLYAQGGAEPVNDVTVSVGESFSFEESLNHWQGFKALDVSNTPFFGISYTRSVTEAWAWRLDGSIASYESEVTWQNYLGQTVRHDIKVFSYDALVLYRFRPTSGGVTPYLGAGLNMMRTSGDPNKILPVNTSDFYEIRPASKTHYGPALVAGLSWKLSNRVAIKTEAQYCRNGWVGETREGGRVVGPWRGDSKTVYLNPLNLSVGLSFRW